MASGWHMGISSAVRLAAMMPAILAVVSTSPLGRARRLSRSKVSAFTSTTARTMAMRWVGAFPPTSTMVTLPSPVMWLKAASSPPGTGAAWPMPPVHSSAEGAPHPQPHPVLGRSGPSSP